MNFKIRDSEFSVLINQWYENHLMLHRRETDHSYLTKMIYSDLRQHVEFLVTLYHGHNTLT
jgi:hypothetical protein